ncbi:MAG: metallophosphoesterase family protein [Bacteroidales bacterium]|nr:metallophosphoesterase family protein [Bacteroidales bacterium]
MIIGLLSDTHSVLKEGIKNFFKDCDEIWHAGDWGDISVLQSLREITPVIRGVYGNIDGPGFHADMPENLIFNIDKVKVLMTHIGGYPNKYQSRIKKLMLTEKPQLFISGHSHILKVIFDKNHNLLHINPGAAGRSGFHKISTAIKFEINNDKIEKLQIYELAKGLDN